ncbi:hypothetical protein CL614_08465 [archaeon]|nr:hypothetical protein [archaeon]|tara:strand:+ start:1597 stop:2097 length:501 start_codon:yes stop_codon:yes gene_type:complete
MVFMERGLSPLISAVLLIAFVITLFVLISNWIQSGVVEEATSAADAKLATSLDCLSTSVKVSKVCVDNRAEATTVQLNVDNDGEQPIDHVTVRVSGSDGSSATFEQTAGGSFQQIQRVLARTVVNALEGGPVNDVNKIEVFPHLDGGLCQDRLEIITSGITDCPEP